MGAFSALIKPEKSGILDGIKSQGYCITRVPAQRVGNICSHVEFSLGELKQKEPSPLLRISVRGKKKVAYESRPLPVRVELLYELKLG